MWIVFCKFFLVVLLIWLVGLFKNNKLFVCIISFVSFIFVCLLLFNRVSDCIVNLFGKFVLVKWFFCFLIVVCGKWFDK